MKKPSIQALFLTALSCASIESQAYTVNHHQRSALSNRRDALSTIIAMGAGAGAACSPAANANAAEDNQVLSDEEMAARIAKKMELLRSKSSTGGTSVRATDIRSDVNPEAAASLRSRSAVENAKLAMEKQRELKTRDKAQKREDLCEMLGRGC